MLGVKENLKKGLEDAGFDVETAMERFMNNEEIYFRFLKKFCLDSSYQELLQAMQEQNMENAFNAAHTLKGLAGNLSVGILYRRLVPFVEFLRSRDTKAAMEYWPDIKEDYERSVEAIMCVETTHLDPNETCC